MQQTYLSDWGTVLLFMIGGLLFVTVALLVSRIIRPNHPNAQKLSTYESGESPIGSPWAQFNIRFYVLALIFILFEVEIVFIFPWSTIFAQRDLIQATNGSWGWFALVEMLVFIAVLGLGLAYAWVNDHLDWIKPDQKVEDFKSPVPKSFYDNINERYK